MRISARSIALLPLLAALIACGGDPTNQGPKVKNNDNNSTNNTPNDMPNDMPDGGDMDLDQDSPDGSPDGGQDDMERDANPDDMETDPDMTIPNQYCQDVEDLGVIDVTGGVKTVMGNTIGKSSKLNSSCGFQSAPEKIYKFTLSGPARLDLSITPDSALNWAMDLRSGDCDATTTIYCSRNPQTTVVTNDDKTYFLLVEPLDSVAEGSFQLDITPTPLVCLPVGGRSCTGNDLLQCVLGGEREDTLSCAAPCSMDACGGDVCDNAVSVTTFPYTLEGPADPYTSSIDFGVANPCVNPDTTFIPPDPNDPDATMNPGTPGEVTGAMPTPGQDVIFKLPGLMAGQKLTVDASTSFGDESDNAIFVLNGNTCQTDACLVALDIGDVLFEWNVPANGDYTVIVDRRTSSTKPIKVKIDVQ